MMQELQAGRQAAFVAHAAGSCRCCPGHMLLVAQLQTALLAVQSRVDELQVTLCMPDYGSSCCSSSALHFGTYTGAHVWSIGGRAFPEGLPPAWSGSW